MANLRVLIADDHAVLRDGLRSLIDRQKDMTVVAEAANAKEAAEGCVEAAPDVAVLDLSMPGGGIHAIAKIRETCPKTRILVLTMHNDAAHFRAVLHAGAVGYVAKRAAATDLIDAIREVGAGRSYVRVDLPGETLREVVTEPERAGALSVREREVLVLIADGHSNREIAEKLGVAKQTVDTYRLRLQEKLGLKGRAALVRYAVARGLVRRGVGSESPGAGSVRPLRGS